MNEEKEKAIEQLQNSEYNIILIQIWLEEFVTQTKHKIDKLNGRLIQLNGDEARLQIDEQNLLVIQTDLNEVN